MHHLAHHQPMGVFGHDKQSPITKQSLMSHRLRLCFKGSEIALATGFFIATEDDDIYLVTNWHNVTGREPLTHSCKHGQLGIPDSIVVECPVENVGLASTERMFKCVEVTVPLYEDDGLFEPRWREHHKWQDKVDVVLIPITAEQMTGMPEGCSFILLQRGDDELYIEVGTNVDILGYPRGISGGMFPIWKRGSIASEPYHSMDELPKFYVDSATREGMSGSPVFACISGPIRLEGNPHVGQSNGVVRRFLGVYSGRVGNDALGAQLGVVWKESVIAEILSHGVKGQSSVLLSAKAEGSSE